MEWTSGRLVKQGRERIRRQQGAEYYILKYVFLILIKTYRPFCILYPFTRIFSYAGKFHLSDEAFAFCPFFVTFKAFSLKVFFGILAFHQMLLHQFFLEEV